MRIKNRFVPGKRLLCYLLSVMIVLGMALGFSGCKSGKEADDNSSQSPSSSSAAQESSSSSESTDSVESEYPAGYSSFAQNVGSTPAHSSDKTESGTDITINTPWVNPAPDYDRTQINVSRIASANGKYYVEYLGKPYLQYGVQITLGRTAGMTQAKNEEFFQKAAEVKFNTVIIAARWRTLEPRENEYNLYEISKIIEYAKKYNLRVELLWYGCNVCGSTGCSPDYVLKNPERFPMKTNRDFDYSTPELLEREKKALTVMMNYLYDFDQDRRVTTVQILNEPNYGNQYLSQGEAFLNYINQLGRTVKNSPYRVVTRVNFVISDKFLDVNYKFPGEVLALDGIDMVGPDVYVNDIEYIGKFAKRFSTGDLSTNVAHFAEGPGQMYNYSKQVLYSFACNSGFDVYELKAYGNIDCDFGIFRSGFDGWIKRDGALKTTYQWDRAVKVAENVTDDIITLNGMINSVAEQIASCPMDQFRMIFRRTSNYIGNQKITFVTNEERAANRVGAVFLASDGYYYCFTPAKDGYFKFEGKTITGNASVGSFVNGAWQQSDTVDITDGNVCQVKTGYVYRISSDQIR